MQISSKLVIQDQKITQYLLIFQEKDDKSIDRTLEVRE